MVRRPKNGSPGPRKTHSPGNTGRRQFAAFLLILLLAMPAVLSAEIRSSVTLDLFGSALFNPDPANFQSVVLAAGTGDLKFNSTGNSNVRAYLDIKADLGYNFLLSIDKAYIRTRFDNFRFMMGKTRLSWGEGLVFNAADVVMGSSDLNINLTADEFRSNTTWLGEVYIPLGRYSYIEGVVLPPTIDILTYNPADPSTLPGIGETGAGTRLGFQIDSLGDLSVETGYFYKGSEDLHQAYISLQGGSGVNWFLGASTGLNTSESFTLQNLGNDLLISAGYYGVGNLGEQSTLSIRSELLVKGGGSFADKDPLNDYGLYSFVDLSLSAGSYINTYIRGLFSPIEKSAMVSAGASFPIYQGFSFYTDLSVQMGEPGDTFAYASLGGYTLFTGVKFIY